MVKLVCKENPSIFIVAPDELVSEVGGNCWQVGGPQPITYPKHLWEKMDYVSLPSNLDEVADCYKDTVTPEEVDDSEHAYSYETYTEYQIADAFKTGVEWLAGQGGTVTDAYVIELNEDKGLNWLQMPGNQLCDALKNFNVGDEVLVQIRKK